MTSTITPLHDLVLTPQQQDLLFAALNSNRVAGAGSATTDPSALTSSDPLKQTNPHGGLNDSSFLDYDYSFDGADSSFDFSFDNGAQSNGVEELPATGASSSDGSPAADDTPDKRSHPDDEDDEVNEPKRREGSDKVPKKPGRKPLTSEPSSKRKAQNRAAQRAFRERKEKHLKDLETKVAELEKASEATTTENSALRAQVEKMTVELNEYKKRLSLMSAPRSALSATTAKRNTFGNPMMNNLADVNFQFEFPKFGQLPGPSTGASVNGGAASAKSATRQNSANSATSPQTKSSSNKPSPSDSNYSSGLDSQTRDDLAKFSGIFSPPLTNQNIASVSDTSSHKNSLFSLAGASTSSPSASSNSNGGPSSSCGTSPEPFTQSPMGFKPVDTLTTIGEEQSTGFNPTSDAGHFANIDSNDISWLASQNNFQFDPQLFGNYREPQDSLITTTGFDDSFFNDAFDMDFLTPYNVAPSPVAPAPKTDLIAQIDAAKNSDNDVVADPEVLMNCTKIWERLQGCPKVQTGDFDLDALCSDLQKKAKCTGNGAVIGEKDFNHVMKKYLCPEEAEKQRELAAQGNTTS